MVGFLGFNHDRKLALRALAVSAAKTDVHAVFAGYVRRRPDLVYGPSVDPGIFIDSH